MRRDFLFYEMRFIEKSRDFDQNSEGYCVNDKEIEALHFKRHQTYFEKMSSLKIATLLINDQ